MSGAALSSPTRLSMPGPATDPHRRLSLMMVPEAPSADPSGLSLEDGAGQPRLLTAQSSMLSEAAAAAAGAAEAAAAKAGQGQNQKGLPKWGTKASAVHRSQTVLPNVKAIFGRIHTLTRGPQANVTQELGNRSVWDMLKGGATQQRVWTLGNSMAGSTPCAAGGEGNGKGRHTSQYPLPLIDGRVITSIAAGHYHGAAVAAGSCEVYIWGSGRSSSSPAPVGRYQQPDMAHPWRPRSCEPVMVLPVTEVQLLPRRPSITGLLDKLPASLRQGLKEIDPEGEKAQQNSFRFGGSEMRLLRVTLAFPVRAVACGADHTLAAMASRGVMAWGWNSRGQVGIAPTTSDVVQEPVWLTQLSNVKVAALSGGDQHSAAVTSEGAVWTWGDNRFGQLGTGSVSGSPQPEPGRLQLHLSSQATSVACGAFHTLALTAAGEVYAWGSDSCGQLGPTEPPGSGRGDASAAGRPARVPGSGSSGVPCRVHGLPPCVQIAASSISAGVSCAGRLYLWGRDDCLNPQPEPDASAAPSLAPSPGPSSARVSIGGDIPDSSFSDGRGLEHAWSRSGRWAPAVPELPLQPPPPRQINEVAWLRPKSVRTLALSPSHAFVVTADQCVYTWGQLDEAFGYPLMSHCRKLRVSDLELQSAVAEMEAEPAATPRGPGGGGGSAGPGDECVGFTGASPERICGRAGCDVVQLLAGSVHSVDPDAGLDDPEAEQPVPLLLRRLLMRRALVRIYWEQSCDDPLVRVSLDIFNSELKLSIFEMATPMSTSSGSGGPRSSGSRGRSALGGSQGAMDFFSAGGGFDGQGGFGGDGDLAEGSFDDVRFGAGAAEEEDSGSDETCDSDDSGAARRRRGRKARRFATPQHVRKAVLDAAPSPDPKATREDTASDPSSAPPAPEEQLAPRLEPIFLVAAGRSHTLCLCGLSTYQASPGTLYNLSILLISQVAWQYTMQQARVAPDGRATSPARVPLPDGATIPRSLHHLPSGSGGSGQEPWRDTVAGPGLCVVLCRQLGLIDNLVEYMDVLAAFSSHLSGKNSRLPPSIVKEQQRQRQLKQQQQREQQQQQQQRLGCRAPQQFPGPPPSPTASLALAPSRAGSAGLRYMPGRSSVDSALPPPQPGRARLSSTAGSGGPLMPGWPFDSRPSSPCLRLVDSLYLSQQLEQEDEEVETVSAMGLDAEEMLELMLDLMAERNPHLCDLPQNLLALLCSRHLPLLQVRAPAGLPWVLSKVLTPRMLLLLDAGGMSEMLHRAYVYMTSEGVGALDDLHLTLKDMKLGLRSNNAPKGPMPDPVDAAAEAAAAVEEDNAEYPGTFGKLPTLSRAQLSMIVAGISDSPGKPRSPGAGPPSRRGAAQSPKRRGSTAKLQLPAGSAALEVEAACAPTSFSVPLLRVAQFIRQAGLVPKLLAQLITEIIDEIAPLVRRVPFHEMCPWWWSRDRTLRPLALVSQGLGAFRNCPETIDLLSRPVLMGILSEYDVMGTPLPRTRKIHEQMLGSEAFQAVEQRRRDRLLAYLLAHLLGSYLAPISHPDQQRPSHMLALPLSYPQFVECVGTCLVLRMSTQHEMGLYKEVKLTWATMATMAAMANATENINLWRERVLSPWKYNRIFFTDAELDAQIDRVFSLFATINPIENKVTMNVFNFQRMMDVCNIYDEDVTSQKANLIFLVCSRLNPRKIYDFAAMAKDQEKREHSSRLQILREARRNQVPDGEEDAASEAAVEAAVPGQRKQENTFLYAWEADKKKEEMEQERKRKQMERRRKAMGRRTSKNKDDDDDDSDSDTEQPVPEGWPTPFPDDVSLLAAMEMPSLQVPRHRPGDLTFLQKQQLMLDLAELPLDDDWSGLTRKQMGRLYTAPMALNLARQELNEGLQSAVEFAAAERAANASAAANAQWEHQFELMGGEGSVGSLPSGPPGSGRASTAPASWSHPESGGGDRTSTPGSHAVEAELYGSRPSSRSPSRMDKRLGPVGPPRQGAESALAAGETNIIAGNPPGPAEVMSSAKAAVKLLAALEDPSLARSFLPPPLPSPASLNPQLMLWQNQGSGKHHHRRHHNRQHKEEGAGGPSDTSESSATGSESESEGRPRTAQRITLVEPHEGSRPSSPSRLSHMTSRGAGSGAGSPVPAAEEHGGPGRAQRSGSLRQPAAPPAENAGHGSRPSSVRGAATPPPPRSTTPSGARALAPSQSAADGRAQPLSRSQSAARAEEPGGAGQPGQPLRSSTPPVAVSVQDSVNRLTTTKQTLSVGMKKGVNMANPSELYETHLDRRQFGEVLRRLAVAKFAKISSPIAAWRIIVDRHILPVAASTHGRFDAYLAASTSPGIIATMLAWEPQIKRLYTAYSRPEVRTTSAPASRSSRRRSRRSRSRPVILTTTPSGTEIEDRVSLVGFLKLLQDRNVLPQMLPPSDMEEIFRRVYFGTGGCSVEIQPLTYPQFANAITMTALALYDQKKYKNQYHTQETKLEALYCILCGMPLPLSAPLTANAQQIIFGRVQTDPYKDWWDLADSFKEEEDTQAVSYLSSNSYCSVLVQELVIPPDPCPPEIIAYIEEASCLHNNGKYDDAVMAYYEAQLEWDELRTASAPEGSFLDLGLLTNQRLYFSLAVASVLLSAGRYEEALEQYDTAQLEVDRLPPEHPNVALQHSCRAFALHTLGRLPLAFEHLVKAMVLRSQTAILGPKHVDTHLACHNLGCVLDRLGCVHRALELIDGAHKVFQQSLGTHHPRTQAACRNLRHVQHKAMQLELHYNLKVDKPKAAPQDKRFKGPMGPAVFPQSKDQQRQQAAARTAALAATAVAGGGNGGGSSSGARRGGRDAAGGGGGPQQLSVQERLAAFRARRSSATQPSSCGPANLMYLGGGMHAADGDTLALYEHMRADIARHASGALAVGIPEDVVVVERVSSAPAGVTRASIAARAAPSSVRSPTAAAAAANVGAMANFNHQRLAVRGTVPDQAMLARKPKKRFDLLNSMFRAGQMGEVNALGGLRPWLALAAVNQTTKTSIRSETTSIDGSVVAVPKPAVSSRRRGGTGTKAKEPTDKLAQLLAPIKATTETANYHGYITQRGAS